MMFERVLGLLVFKEWLFAIRVDFQFIVCTCIACGKKYFFGQIVPSLIHSSWLGERRYFPEPTISVRKWQFPPIRPIMCSDAKTRKREVSTDFRTLCDHCRATLRIMIHEQYFKLSCALLAL